MNRALGIGPPDTAFRRWSSFADVPTAELWRMTSGELHILLRDIANATEEQLAVIAMVMAGESHRLYAQLGLASQQLFMMLATVQANGNASFQVLAEQAADEEFWQQDHRAAAYIEAGLPDREVQDVWYHDTSRKSRRMPVFAAVQSGDYIASARIRSDVVKNFLLLVQRRDGARGWL
jgi:hypothetical protein